MHDIPALPMINMAVLSQVQHEESRSPHAEGQGQYGGSGTTSERSWVAWREQGQYERGQGQHGDVVEGE